MKYRIKVRRLTTEIRYGAVEYNYNLIKTYSDEA